MEERKQQSQSQVKLFEANSRVMGGARQPKEKVASRPTKQLFDELGGNTPEIFMKLVNFISHICKLTIQ